MNDHNRLEEVADAYRLRKAQIADPRSILPIQNYLNPEVEGLIKAAQPENPRQTERALALMLLSVSRQATTWAGFHGKAHGHVATVLPVLFGVYLRQQQQDGKSEEWPLWARPHPSGEDAARHEALDFLLGPSRGYGLELAPFPLLAPDTATPSFDMDELVMRIMRGRVIRSAATTEYDIKWSRPFERGTSDTLAYSWYSRMVDALHQAADISTLKMSFITSFDQSDSPLTLWLEKKDISVTT